MTKKDYLCQKHCSRPAMKTAFRLAVVTALLVCALPSLRAQEEGFFRKLNRKLTTPSRVYDTSYVYQLDLPGVVSPAADLIWTGINLHRDVSIQKVGGEEELYYIENHLSRELFEKAGVGISYGTLAFNYTFELNRHDTRRNKYYNFSFIRPRFAVNFRYYHIHEYLAGTLVPVDTPSASVDFTSQDPGQMRHVVIDGIFFFNPEHFSYLATTGRNVVQRRSAGSWLATACYSQGEYKYDKSDGVVQEFPDHIGRLQTGAFSFGGGYSFNWVPYHRAPHGDSVRGFRNLTINATLMPRISLYDHVLVTQYKDPAKSREWEVSKDHNFFLPALHLSAHAGFIYSWSRYFICATADFERYGFRKLETVSHEASDGRNYKTLTRGSFYSVTTRIQFNVRF